MARASAVVERERICAIVAAHIDDGKSALADTATYEYFRAAEQSRHRDRVALSLLQIEKRDPQATVLLLPADHHVGNETALAGALIQMTDLAGNIETTFTCLAWNRTRRTRNLLHRSKPGLLDGAADVSAFVEKPSLEQARGCSRRRTVEYVHRGRHRRRVLDLFDRSYNFVRSCAACCATGSPWGC